MVTVECETFEGNKLVNVTWKNKGVMMFTQDLRSRAKRLKRDGKPEVDGDQIRSNVVTSCAPIITALRSGGQ
jgi:hypothetical protein